MASSLLRRGGTYYARVTLPPDRWADIGKALGAKNGVRREVVRTLRTGDRKTALGRLDAATAAIVREIDAALVRASRKPLTDWTVDWLSRALERQDQIREGGAEVAGEGYAPDGEPHELLARDFLLDAVEADAEVVERRRGASAAATFIRIATSSALSVAAAKRKWLAEISGSVRGNTVASHEAALRKLSAFLAETRQIPSLDALGLPALTRRDAGDFITMRVDQGAAPETICREASAMNGLWRWAIRRGHATENPWADQTAGLKARLGGRRTSPGGHEREYSARELVRLLRATEADLAPNGGGYVATMWDLIRLLLLTGCRVGELTALEVGDVIANGTALVIAARGGKTDAASRIVPLHPFAMSVVSARLACIPTADRTAPLWPEIPPQGPDQRRSKVIATRFPAIRRRLLGESNEVDLHSFRRTFISAAENAMNSRGALNPELIALLVGHRRHAMAFDLYSEWSRLGRRARLEGVQAERLAVLQAAVRDIVGLGLDATVLTALAETSALRPAMTRTAPAFTRSASARLSPPA